MDTELHDALTTFRTAIEARHRLATELADCKERTDALEEQLGVVREQLLAARNRLLDAASGGMDWKLGGC